MSNTRSRRGRLRTWAAASGLVAMGMTTIVAVDTARAAGCEAVDYDVVNDWGTGHQVSVSVTAGSEPIDGWTIRFDLPSGVGVANLWNADWTQSGSTVTASDAGWNGFIPTGSTQEIFGAVLDGPAAVPSEFVLNGEVCGVGPEPTEGPTDPGPEPTGPGGEPGTSPTWGQAGPPADAERSRAYELIAGDDPKGYEPRFPNECSSDVHARYWTYGPDGKVYPTWHPNSDPSGCDFGHEHGDDPRDSGPIFDRYGWPAFGYTSEVMLDSLPEGSQRHEDHVGHKVVATTNLRAIEGDDGSSLFPPQGNGIATCDTMIKYHQGTHSPDAFTNNVHEVLLDQRCERDGRTFETSYKAMVPFGEPGRFSSHDCPGPFLSRTYDVGPATPVDGPTDTASIGRLITGPECAQAIRDGETRYDPISGGTVPLDSDQLHEFWFGTGSINGAGVDFTISPLLYSLRPSRYYDPSKPNDLGRQVDLCSDPQIGGEPCDIVRQNGGNVAWDSPQSPFDGALRDIRIGQFSQSVSGPTTIYTDAYGRNASTVPFEGAIEQYFSGSSGSGIYLRGALKDWATSTTHAPN